VKKLITIILCGIASLAYAGGSTDTMTATSLAVNSEYTLPAADGTADQVLTTDGAGAVSWQDATGASLSNVIFSFSTGGSNYASGSYGVYSGTAQKGTSVEHTYWAVYENTYRTLIYAKFHKNAGVNHITCWARLWQNDTGSRQANCQVTIGSASCVIASAGGDAGGQSPAWYSNTIDVSGLINGTTYDVTIALRNSWTSLWAYMSDIVAIAS